MPTLFMRFPGRRYHATPWGHHVNEGLIEWPPSPWRLLRALIATGYTTAGWSEEDPPAEARALIEKLATVLPSYRLPEASGAHSRHYMPLARFKNEREETTLVFDTWAQVDAAELAISWDVPLAERETEEFARLADRMGYLGRSESWVLARLASSDEPVPDGWDCLPCDGSPEPGPGWEQIRLIAAQPAEHYARWRNETLGAELARLPAADTTKTRLTADERKAIELRRKVEAPYPADLLACLQVTTDWLRRYGWSQPPGSRRVFYWRRADALEAGAPRIRLRRVSASTVEAMLLSMATPSANDHALPSIVRTLPQAELLHRALVEAASRDGGVPGKVLTGCDENGKSLTEPHCHAHIIPLDLDGDGHLEHLLIWAPIGLDAAAQRAVRAVRRTFTKGGIGPLRLAVVAASGLHRLRRLPGPYGDGLRSVLGDSNGATQWASLTPFVPPRHLKKNGRNALQGQVATELASRGFPAPIELRVLDARDDARLLRLRHFVRSRRFGPEPPIDCGFALSLRFAEPLPGPIALGYGCHFGLGVFGSIRL